MGEMMLGVTDAHGLLLSAASAACTAACDMVEVAREGLDHGANLRFRETAETCADILQTVCSIELSADDVPADRREAIGDLISAVSRFIEGWA